MIWWWWVPPKDWLTKGVAGEGSKQDATSHLIGVRFPEGGFMPCEDDEDLCDPGSGSGPGGHGVFPESNSLDSKSSVIEVGNDHLYSFTSTFLFPSPNYSFYTLENFENNSFFLRPFKLISRWSLRQKQILGLICSNLCLNKVFRVLSSGGGYHKQYYCDITQHSILTTDFSHLFPVWRLKNFP